MKNKIKQEDKVRVSKDAPKIYTDGWLFDWRNSDSIVFIVENDDAVILAGGEGGEELVIPIKYLVKVDAEAEKKPNVGSIKIPVEVDLTDSYWDAYTAGLAKEVVPQVANKYNVPEHAAEYAVRVAKAVVKELKRKNAEIR